MIASKPGSPLLSTTSYKVVLPFYLYAAFSFFAATALLFFSTDAFLKHYFQPHLLAITHIMATGLGHYGYTWGKPPAGTCIN